MSFADKYACFEDFLKADPEYARIHSEVTRLTKLHNETGQKVEKATRNYHKWMCCEAALEAKADDIYDDCLLYTSPSPRDQRGSRMPSSA